MSAVDDFGEQLRRGLAEGHPLVRQRIELPRELRIITLLALSRMHADLNVRAGDRAQAIEAMAVLEDADITAVKHPDAAPYVPGEYSGRPDNRVSPPEGPDMLDKLSRVLAVLVGDRGLNRFWQANEDSELSRQIAGWLREPGP